ncbi:MAG: hypothetical protein ACRYG2_20840 [Janthinobacterium lividum]
MPKDRTAEVARARSALIVAATRRSLLTYAELGQALDMGQPGTRNPALAHQLNKILDKLAEDCTEREEPVLAALVVNMKTGLPGAGWTAGSTEWHALVRQIFDHWRPV